MTSYERIEQWLQDMEVQIENENDSQEKFLLQGSYNHIKRNLPYYFKSQLEKGIDHFFCKECGAIEFAGYVQPTKDRLIENQLCFSCDFWKQREKEHLKNPFIIVKGISYRDGGNKSNYRSDFLGHAGCVFNIVMLDGSKEWSTNNLWCGGDIPKKYRLTTMQDTAKFV